MSTSSAAIVRSSLVVSSPNPNKDRNRVEILVRLPRNTTLLGTRPCNTTSANVDIVSADKMPKTGGSMTV